jgi:hypothetical protein
MLIDRRDGVINLCEIKYTKHPFTIDKNTEESLSRKKMVFESEANPKKALHLTMITTYGLTKNGYFSSAQSEVMMDDIFAD